MARRRRAPREEKKGIVRAAGAHQGGNQGNGRAAGALQGDMKKKWPVGQLSPQKIQKIMEIERTSIFEKNLLFPFGSFVLCFYVYFLGLFWFAIFSPVSSPPSRAPP